MKSDNEQQTDMPHPRQLTTFMGYTVDERLREFRKVDHATLKIEFIPFESAKGQKVLQKYLYHKSDAIGSFEVIYFFIFIVPVFRVFTPKTLLTGFAHRKPVHKVFPLLGRLTRKPATTRTRI